MRVISNALKTAQELNNRYPLSKIEVFDSMLRWSQFMAAYTSDVSDAFLSVSESDASGVPAAYLDADYLDGSIYSTAVEARDAPELITNGSFDGSIQGWEEDYNIGSAVIVSYDTAIPYSSPGCIKMLSPGIGAISFSLHSPYFTAAEGKGHTAETKMRLDLINPASTVYFELLLSWYDDSGNLLDSDSIPLASHGGEGWISVGLQSVPPANTAYGAIRVTVDAVADYPAFALYFDDVSVKSYPDLLSLVYAIEAPLGIAETNGGQTTPARASVLGSSCYYVEEDDGTATLHRHSLLTDIDTELCELYSSVFGHALAAVASDEGYHAWLIGSSLESDIVSRIGIEAFVGASTVSMDYTIPVEPEYANASLSWFDAVRLDDGTDVILVNTETYGKPEIILRRNGVWGDRFPMIPSDVVDNYSYLRIGWLKLYEGVIYATGELGRKGSTGLHPQSMAVVLKSIDGVHWSMDRWRYLGQTPFRSPLLMDDSGYAYYIDVPDLYRAPLTPIFGLQDSDASDGGHVYFEIQEDIISWNASMREDRETGNLGLQLRDALRQYSDPLSPTALKPGYMLRLWAGYKTPTGDEYVQLGWYGVDSTPTLFGSANSELSVSAREWNMRSLGDNNFDQDWQWLSQVRHFDDCNRRDYLYSIGGETVRTIESTKQLQTGDVASDDGNLKVYASVDKTVLVSSRPFEANDGFASVAFLADGAYSESDLLHATWRLGFNEYGLEYDLARQHIGTGAGAALIKDEHNFITAFLDLRTRQLILLQVAMGTASDASEEWTEVEKQDVSAYVNTDWLSASENAQLYEVELESRGNSVIYGLGISEANIPQFAASYDPNTITRVRYESTVERNGENRLGIVVGTGNPTVKVVLHDNDDAVQPGNQHGRALSDFNNGVPIEDSEEDGHQPYYLETSEYKWEDFRNVAPNRSPGWGNGFVYVDGEKAQRGLSYGSSLIVDSYVPASYRGDFVTGLWPIYLTTPYTANYEAIVLDTTLCYPPGGDPSYWVGLIADSDYYVHSGFWFMDGDLEGKFLPLYHTSPIHDMGGGYVEFRLQANPGRTLHAAAGDNVIFCPGIRVSAQDFGGSAHNIYWGYEPVGVTLQSFIAHDLERQKSIQWTLDDIIAKAGILTTLGGLSTGAKEYIIDETYSSGATEHYLAGRYKNFDLHITLSTPIEDSEQFSTSFGRANLTDPNADAAWLTIIRVGSSLIATLGSYVDETWIYHIARVATYVDAVNFRIVKQEEFVSLWIEDRLVLAFPLRKRWKDCAFSDTVNDYGHVYFVFTQAGATFTVKQERLWTPIDGIVADQQTNALSALSRVIRDARIKVLPDQDLAVRISSFATRDNCGTVADTIFQDRVSPTDAMPTHVRVIGEEIGEYFDHTALAQYGVMFASRNVESLAEEEAYQEAILSVQDALGNNDGRQNVMAAQLQYEPEDEITVAYTGLDGRIVSEDCIINSLQFSFNRPTLEMSLSLRKKYAV